MFRNLKHDVSLGSLQIKIMSLSFQTTGQRMIMECIKCEINLLTRDVKMNDYSKAGVEVLNQTHESSAMCVSAACWYRRWSKCQSLDLLFNNVSNNPDQSLHFYRCL